MSTDQERADLESAPSEMALLEVAELTAGYGDAIGIRNVSLRLPPGQMVGLLGSNGAGKTTTLLATFGLIEPWAGSVRLFGDDVTGRSPRFMVKNACVLVPEGRGLIPDLTVAQHLELGGYYCKRSDVAAHIARVVELFPILGVRARQRAGLLSGGEQQMLAIARGLVAQPRVLLIDELSLGLAPQIIEALYERLRLLVDDEDMAVLVVEQHSAMALDYCDRLYVLQGQTVAKEGLPSDFADHQALRELYLRG